MGPSPAEIDRVVVGMLQSEVRDLLGEPVKVFPAAYDRDESWMYRDERHRGGNTYISFDRKRLVTRIQGAASFG
jgi:outer membrane protein assembly factor BamE (lipoprotein component of BamABCDE complex)